MSHLVERIQHATSFSIRITIYSFMNKKSFQRRISSLLTLFHGKKANSELHFYFPSLHCFFLFLSFQRTLKRFNCFFFLCILLAYKFHLSGSNRPCTKRVILGLVWGDRFSLLFFSQSLYRRNVLVLLLGFVSLYLLVSTLFATKRRVPSAVQIIHTPSEPCHRDPTIFKFTFR